MNKYPKIQTVYKRDSDNNNKTLLEGKFSEPAFEFLKNSTWMFTEKVNGRNHRAIWRDEEIEHRGKTDRANFSDEMIETVTGIFTPEKMERVFGDRDVCIYGELYGKGIQKGGLYKKDGQDFVLLDVKIGNWWLKRENIEDIAKALDIDIVPIIGEGTLKEMVELARKGFKSQWGDFIAEGIVAKPALELRTRRGDRIITKIKFKDFKHVT